MPLLFLHIHQETKKALNASILQKQSAARPEKSLHEHTAATEQTEEKVISLHFVFWGDLSSHSTDRSLLSS